MPAVHDYQCLMPFLTGDSGFVLMDDIACHNTVVQRTVVRVIVRQSTGGPVKYQLIFALSGNRTFKVLTVLKKSNRLLLLQSGHIELLLRWSTAVLLFSSSSVRKDVCR